VKLTKVEGLEAKLQQARRDRELAKMELDRAQPDVRSERPGAQQVERAAFTKLRLLDGTINQLVWALDKARLEERDRRIAQEEKHRVEASDRKARVQSHVYAMQQAEINVRRAERMLPEWKDVRSRAERAVADLPKQEQQQYRERLAALAG
jgi:hypothetical protein